nr:MAG TPA: hypothetical protein [Caudoviricetes sp.]
MAFSALWLGAALLGKGTREVSIARNLWNLFGAGGSGSLKKKSLSPAAKK